MQQVEIFCSLIRWLWCSKTGAITHQNTCYMKKKMTLAFSPGNFRFCLFSLFSLFAAVGLYAQTVTGVVKDAENQPVSGATITVKGTNTATVTNDAGSFSINAGPTATLVITHVNFLDQEIQVNNRTSLSVSMNRLEGTIDEVVVTALGIRRQAKKLGYSTTSVNTDELIKNRTTKRNLPGKCD